MRNWKFWKRKQEETPPQTQYMPKTVLKNKLPEALQFAITALKRGIFNYEWINQGACNCGIVVAAMLDGNRNDSKAVYDLAHAQAQEEGALPEKKGAFHHTWRELAQASCSATGMPLTNVFKSLAEMGFSPEDVVHLEYMTNPAILKESKINTKMNKYYSVQENLILYLEAWYRILLKFPREKYSRKEDLEADLLIAVAEEKYEIAARIKKELLIA